MLKIYSIEYHKNSLTVIPVDDYDKINDHVEDWMFDGGIMGIYERPFFLDLEDFQKCYEKAESKSIMRRKPKAENFDMETFMEEGNSYLGENDEEVFYLIESERDDDEVILLEDIQNYYSKDKWPIVYDISKLTFCRMCRSYCYDFYCLVHGPEFRVDF